MNDSINNRVNLPKIIRVRHVAEARYEAGLHGLMPSQWRYCERTEHIKGLRFQDGMTYYINHDIPYWEIEIRLAQQ